MAAALYHNRNKSTSNNDQYDDQYDPERIYLAKWAHELGKATRNIDEELAQEVGTDVGVFELLMVKLKIKFP